MAGIKTPTIKAIKAPKLPKPKAIKTPKVKAVKAPTLPKGKLGKI